MNTETNAPVLPVDLNNLKNQCPDSNKIHAYEHGSDGTLYLQFKSNAGRATYAYPNHPAEDIAKLEAAESKGKHFNKEWVAQFQAFEKLPGTTQPIVWPSRAPVAEEGAAQE